MHFAFDDGQTAVRETVAALLAKRADLPTLQAVWAEPTGPAGWSAWPELAAVGVQGLLAPEAVGGSDLDWPTMALVLAEAGRVALPLPVTETAAVGVPVLTAAGDPLGLTAGLVDGSSVLTMTTGPAGVAPAASRADFFLVTGEGATRLYRRDEVDLEAVASVDRTRDLARVTPTGPGWAVPAAGPDPSDLAALGTAAQLVGLGREVVAITVGYVKDRKQFGVPIGSFQAVKHHLADALLAVEFAAPPVWYAAQQLADGDPDALRSISLAKAMASDAAAQAARAALQCHGAMGYTDEYHLHMWLKRIWALAGAHGSAAWHRRRLGDLLRLGR